MHDVGGTTDEALRAEALKSQVRRLLTSLGEQIDDEDVALSARWPEPVLALTVEERERRVRGGSETVLLEDPEAPGGRRGFVRAVLRVPVGHPQGAVYGVFIEVEREGYLSLKKAYESRTETRVWGRLATKLPLLERAYGSEVEILEDGSTQRARIVGAQHALLLEGPAIGPA